MYNYKEEIKNDVAFWMTDNDVSWENYVDEDDAIEAIAQEVWPEDCVTGNGGNYYDTPENCAHYLADNINTMIECLEEFEVNWHDFKRFKGAEIIQVIDCTVRCALLRECLYEMWEEDHK